MDHDDTSSTGTVTVESNSMFVSVFDPRITMVSDGSDPDDDLVGVGLGAWVSLVGTLDQLESLADDLVTRLTAIRRARAAAAGRVAS